METAGPHLSSAIDGSHHHRYLQYAISILTAYKGNEPFHLFLKKYFALHKKHGSRDRKFIAALCYNYFRLGYGVSGEMDRAGKLRLASYLCETDAPQAPGAIVPLIEKLAVVGKQFDVEKIFPFADELSDEITRRQYNASFLIQPKLYIRIRPGCKEVTAGKIKTAGLFFKDLGEGCLAFDNNEKVSGVIDIDKEAVVQDYNSQKTLRMLQERVESREPGISLWDCCAGSGGKSILAVDILKQVQLTVSDKRINILESLENRFNVAGIKNYKSVLVDLQLPCSTAGTIPGPFDCIIADVPCSGSGTWCRTPEQLAFFHKKDIATYAALQRKIMEHSIPHLKAGGYYVYITCSVFKKENEENVAYIQREFHLSLLGMKYLEGYEMQADTLFVALFTPKV
ncbi:MAG: Fmu (Sun) domain-containing protein [Ginsengibacter sp.]